MDKKLSASEGLCPPPDHPPGAEAPEPRWGLCPQTPIFAMIPPGKSWVCSCN